MSASPPLKRTRPCVLAALTNRAQRVVAADKRLNRLRADPRPAFADTDRCIAAAQAFVDAATAALTAEAERMTGHLDDLMLPTLQHYEEINAAARQIAAAAAGAIKSDDRLCPGPGKAKELFNRLILTIISRYEVRTPPDADWPGRLLAVTDALHRQGNWDTLGPGLLLCGTHAVTLLTAHAESKEAHFSNVITQAATDLGDGATELAAMWSAVPPELDWLLARTCDSPDHLPQMSQVKKYVAVGTALAVSARSPP